MSEEESLSDKINRYWDDWGVWVEEAKVDPKAAVSTWAVDNLKWVIPIVGVIAGFILIKLFRRGD